MKAKILFCFFIGLLTASFTSFAAGSVPASQDTIVIPGDLPTAVTLLHNGALEATINGDTLSNGSRINPNRIYALQEGYFYYQNAPININNPTGTLTIVGIPSTQGATKPVWLMKPMNNIPVQINNLGCCNVVYGSIKFVNIHYQAMQLYGTMQTENFLCGSQNQLPQSLTIDNCLFEFSNLDLFDCSNDYGTIAGWPYGAKFRITNSYFRNLFNASQWWGSGIFLCAYPIDTLWVENTTIAGSGLTFYTRNSLTAFAYFNHNTIVNNHKYWLFSPFYKKLYVTNNIFINQNWVGEDTNVTYGGGQDPDKEFMSTINIDTIDAYHQVLVQPQYSNGSGGYTDSVNLFNMTVYVSNNINYYDPLLINGYYESATYLDAAIGALPSYLDWFNWGTGPRKIGNTPGEWMNTRTKALFTEYSPLRGGGFIEENTSTANPNTVTPGIADASVVTAMAQWNQYLWGDPRFPTAPNITGSKYIFGDFNPATIPGYKTENGSGITKFTDLTENFSQSSYLSTIDNLPIGALIWDDAQLAVYNSNDDLQKVFAGYVKAGGIFTRGHPIAVGLTSVYEPNAGIGPMMLNFSSTGSYELGGGVLDSIFWIVNGNLVSKQPNLTYSFAQGTNQVKLVVKNNYGVSSDSSSAIVNISMFKVAFNGPVYAGPSLLGSGVLYAIGTGDAVYRLDSTGNILYSLGIGGNVMSSSSISYDTIAYIASSDKNLYAFSKYGNAVWPPLPLGGVANSTPVIDSITNRLYIGVSNKNFVAVNRSTGIVSWNYFADAPIASSAAITPDRKLIVATVKGTIYGFDLTNTAIPLTPAWQLALSDSIYSSPAVDNSGYIYYCTTSGRVLKISMPPAQQPSIVWQAQTGGRITGSPVIDGYGNLYVGCSDSKLYAINTQNGNIKWIYQSGSPILSTPAVSDIGMIYFGNHGGKVVALDSSSNMHWYYQDSTSTDAPLLYEHGTLYVGTVGARLLAFYDGADSSIYQTDSKHLALKANSKNIALANTNAAIKPPVWGTFQGNNQRTGVYNGSLITDVKDKTNLLPTQFSLSQNYPNPMNPSTTISFSLPSQSFVSLKIYDVLGREVATIVSEELPAGTYSRQWNAGKMSSGVYFYRLQAGSFTQTKRLVLLK